MDFFFQKTIQEMLVESVKTKMEYVCYLILCDLCKK